MEAPGPCSRLPEPHTPQAAQSSLFQLTRSSGPAHTSWSSPLAMQDIPQPLLVSISIHSFPGWGYGGTTNPTYFRVQGSRAKILHTCSIQQQEFLHSEIQRRVFLSLKIYFNLKTFLFSIEFEPLTPSTTNATQLTPCLS